MLQALRRTNVAKMKRKHSHIQNYHHKPSPAQEPPLALKHPWRQDMEVMRTHWENTFAKLSIKEQLDIFEPNQSPTFINI